METHSAATSSIFMIMSTFDAYRFVLIILTMIWMVDSESRDIDSAKSSLQSAADMHTVDACLQTDRSQITAPHSPIKVLGIASLGFKDTRKSDVRGSHDNHCLYALRPPDEKSQLSIRLQVQRIGMTRGFKANKFRIAPISPPATSAANSTRRLNRIREGRFEAAREIDTLSDAQAEKGFGVFLSFQNDQRMLSRAKRDVREPRDGRGVGEVDEIREGCGERDIGKMRDGCGQSDVDETLEGRGKQNVSKALEGLGGRDRRMGAKVGRRKRSIPTQPNKDVYFTVTMDRDPENTDCYLCSGLCAERKDVVCNFINDCGMKDEEGCPNPDNLSIIEPPGILVVEEPTTTRTTTTMMTTATMTATGGPGGGGKTIDPAKFQVYLNKCDPEVRESCEELAACLEDSRCGPKSGDEYERAIDLIDQWRENFPGRPIDVEPRATGITWWIPVVVSLIFVIIIIIVVVSVEVVKRKRRRRTANSPSSGQPLLDARR